MRKVFLLLFAVVAFSCSPDQSFDVNETTSTDLTQQSSRELSPESDFGIINVEDIDSENSMQRTDTSCSNPTNPNHFVYYTTSGSETVYYEVRFGFQSVIEQQDYIDLCDLWKRTPNATSKLTKQQLEDVAAVAILNRAGPGDSHYCGNHTGIHVHLYNGQYQLWNGNNFIRFLTLSEVNSGQYCSENSTQTTEESNLTLNRTETNFWCVNGQRAVILEGGVYKRYAIHPTLGLIYQGTASGPSAASSWCFD